MRTRNLLKGVVVAAGAAFLGFVVFTAAGSHGSSPSQASWASSNAGSSTPALVDVAFTKSPAKGKALFEGTCAMCHGPAGQGTSMGADLQTNKFVATHTDAQVVDFITHGISGSNPNNAMHMTMPPKGGNSSLTTQDLYDIVSYIRQIQKTAKTGAHASHI